MTAYATDLLRKIDELSDRENRETYNSQFTFFTKFQQINRFKHLTNKPSKNP